MTNGSSRLDRIESILTNLAERQDRFQTQIEESDRNLRESISDVVSLIGNLAEQDDQRAAEYRQRHEEHDQRFNNLLADARSDRQKADQRHAEWVQHFDTTLAELRSDRQTNEREHQAFRESFQSLLAEIRAIWQRLAG